MTHPTQDFTSEVSTNNHAGQSYRTLSGFVNVVCDHEGFAYYMDLSDGYLPAESRQAIAQMKSWGLEPIGEDECPTEDLDNGDVRMHFTFIEAVSFADPLALSWV